MWSNRRRYSRVDCLDVVRIPRSVIFGGAINLDHWSSHWMARVLSEGFCRDHYGKPMKTQAIIFLLVLLLFSAVVALAHDDDSAIALSEYQKQEWHVEDGLPQSNVRTIIQAKNRLLLIGTSEGIASFDGLHFTPLRVGSSGDTSHEPVNALLISKAGDFWIGTDDRGVIRQRGNQTLAISEEA